MLASLNEDLLISLQGLQIAGIIYLAVAISSLRERLARLETKIEDLKNGVKKNNNHV